MIDQRSAKMPRNTNGDFSNIDERDSGEIIYHDIYDPATPK
jgi:hypothetical protein